MRQTDEREKALAALEHADFLQDVSFFPPDETILQEIKVQNKGRAKLRKKYLKNIERVAVVVLSILLLGIVTWSIPIARAYISLFVDRVILSKAPVTLVLGVERAVLIDEPESNNFGLYQTHQYRIDGAVVNVSVEPKTVNTKYYSDRVYEHIGIITGSPTGEPASCYRDDESVSAILLVGEQRIIIAVYGQNFDLLKEIVLSLSIHDEQMEVGQ